VATLDELRAGAHVDGLVAGKIVTIRSVQRNGTSSATITYADEATGHVGENLVFQSDLDRLRIVENARQWAFDGDGALFRLAAEAQRIRLAYLYNAVLAVHTSNVVPLPRQLAAAYESMPPRLPLRFLLADDPGAGKTIMAGLLTGNSRKSVISQPSRWCCTLRAHGERRLQTIRLGAYAITCHSSLATMGSCCASLRV
jgi:hypothetical protein